jgi:hypothetical protein
MWAYDYPILGIFWSMLFFFLWMMWLFLFIRIIMDIFRSKDMGGVMKTVWIFFVFILPFLGALVYVLARGNGMAQRDLDQATQQRQQFDQYVRETAGSSGGGTADEIAKLAQLKEQGALTDAEFAAQKAKLLA